MRKRTQQHRCPAGVISCTQTTAALTTVLAEFAAGLTDGLTPAATAPEELTYGPGD